MPGMKWIDPIVFFTKFQKPRLQTDGQTSGWIQYTPIPPSVDRGYNNATWRHKSLSTLFQVMARCLTTSSHYLNQCWLLVNKDLWHSPQSNFKLHLPESNELIEVWPKRHSLRCTFNTCFQNMVICKRVMLEALCIQHGMYIASIFKTTLAITLSSSSSRTSTLLLAANIDKNLVTI